MDQLDYSKEEWASITNFPWYEISSYGRVRSIDRISTAISGTKRNLRGKILKLSVCPNTGYAGVSLRSKERTTSTAKIHRLVASHFVHNKHSLPVVDHKNGIKTDNHASNLEWVTQSENIIRAVNMGLKPSRKGKTNDTRTPKANR